MPPNILEVTDSSQILSFVVAKQALEDSGYGQSGECDHTRTGVIRRHQTEVWCWPNTYQETFGQVLIRPLCFLLGVKLMF